MDNDIIRIAEAMGWKKLPPELLDERYGEPQFGPGCWTNLDNVFVSENGLPNPKTNHADCHALIEWLNERGYDVEIWWSGNATRPQDVKCRVLIRFRDGRYRQEGEAYDDYRLGVVELTLKLLEKEGD